MTTHSGLDPDTRPAESAVEEYELLEPDLERAPRDEIRAHQEKAVVELVHYAWERSPLYRSLWGAAGVTPDDVTNLAEFSERIPTLTKADIGAFREKTGDVYGGLLCVDPSELVSVTSTSGTTSAPELLPEIWTDAPPLPAISARDLYVHGLRPGDRVVVAVGTFRNYFDEFYQAMGLIPVFADSWLGQGEGILRAIKENRAAYMQVHLPAIMELEKLEAKYDLREALSSIKFLSFAGQPMGAALKRKVTEDWGVKVVTYTSAGDTGTAWEGPGFDGFQLWEDTVYPEVVDVGSGKPVPEGAIGELVATDIDNRAAPYIRFRSGDLVRMSTEPSSIGRTHARMWVSGRAGDETIVDGKAIVVGDVWQIVERQPELSDGMFQILRSRGPMNRLRLRVGYAPERTADIGELEQRVTGELEAGLGVGVEVAMLTLEDILQYSSSAAKFPRTVKV
ncbi:phenylacetate--CoA ligase family protein [Gordonia rhizosphera]|uniref:phenylacetate--CoA ligase family protein n=1 Tax=Gordonia rhizosphera TaxID=83341 RepID=UPI0012F6F0EC|nr:phenylacetate--CoA ligase family protein [Gordonia rhizosphera]